MDAKTVAKAFNEHAESCIMCSQPQDEEERGYLRCPYGNILSADIRDVFRKKLLEIFWGRERIYEKTPELTIGLMSNIPGIDGHALRVIDDMNKHIGQNVGDLILAKNRS